MRGRDRVTLCPVMTSIVLSLYVSDLGGPDRQRQILHALSRGELATRQRAAY
jgi:hypothetical protein